MATLGGTNPAAAASQDFHVTYDSGVGTYTRNSYWVDIHGTVTRDDYQYELTAVVESHCVRDQGSSQEWGMAFGSSIENWRYLSGPSSDSVPYAREKVTVTGLLGEDGRVYLQAGAWGGTNFGSWGWGSPQSVWV
ncbi:hypothetical protein [Streptomyces sp. NPDC017095]|uniref:hypothetical protein n=1 Tax=Streptomyces sp. NPDC017095 TaxID=3364977 RepID=UPI0037B1832C